MVQGKRTKVTLVAVAVIMLAGGLAVIISFDHPNASYDPHASASDLLRAYSYSSSHGSSSPAVVNHYHTHVHSTPSSSHSYGSSTPTVVNHYHTHVYSNPSSGVSHTSAAGAGLLAGKALITFSSFHTSVCFRRFAGCCGGGKQ